MGLVLAVNEHDIMIAHMGHVEMMKCEKFYVKYLRYM